MLLIYKLIRFYKITFKQKKKAGSYLLSRDYPVSSAQESLTSVFGMGTGIASPLWPPALLSCLLKTAFRILHQACSFIQVRKQLSDYSNDNMVKPHGLLVLLG